MALRAFVLIVFAAVFSTCGVGHGDGRSCDTTCLRFRVEVAKCNHECYPWSDADCVEWRPTESPNNSCNTAAGFSCWIPNLADAGMPCPDGGH